MAFGSQLVCVVLSEGYGDGDVFPRQYERLVQDEQESSHGSHDQAVQHHTDD